MTTKNHNTISTKILTMTRKQTNAWKIVSCAGPTLICKKLAQHDAKNSNKFLSIINNISKLSAVFFHQRL